MENFSFQFVISRMSLGDFKAFKRAVRQLERGFMDTQTAVDMVLSAYIERRKLQGRIDGERYSAVEKRIKGI